MEAYPQASKSGVRSAVVDGSAFLSKGRGARVKLSFLHVLLYWEGGYLLLVRSRKATCVCHAPYFPSIHHTAKTFPIGFCPGPAPNGRLEHCRPPQSIESVACTPETTTSIMTEGHPTKGHIAPAYNRCPPVSRCPSVMRRGEEALDGLVVSLAPSCPLLLSSSSWRPPAADVNYSARGARRGSMHAARPSRGTLTARQGSQPPPPLHSEAERRDDSSDLYTSLN